MSFLLVGGVIVYSYEEARDAVTAFLPYGAFLPKGLRVCTEGGNKATAFVALRTGARFSERSSKRALPESGEKEPAPSQESLCTLVVPRPRGGAWMGLAGFPDRTHIRFPLPSGLDARQGELNLVVVSHIAEGGDGRLSVAVNGTPRSEVVLDAGLVEHTIGIMVERDDLLGGYLEVELAARGTTAGGQICPTSAVDSGAVVTLTEQSALALEVAAHGVDGEALLATMRQPFAIRLGDTEGDQAQAIGLAHYLSRRGIDAVFSQTGTNPVLEFHPDEDAPFATGNGNAIVVGGAAGLRRLAALRATRPDVVGWPAFAGAFEVATTEVDFRGKRRWTLRYDLAGLIDGMMPEYLDFALRTGLLTPGASWLAHVSLNGHLLESRRLDGQSDITRWSVLLPAGMQDLSNALDIELVDTSSTNGVCEASPSVKAQLLPETRLVAAAGEPVPGWPRIVHGIAVSGSVTLNVEGLLNPSQALRATSMLSQFVPARTDMGFQEYDGTSGVRLSVFTVAQLRKDPDLVNRVSWSGRHAADSVWFALPAGAADKAVISLYTADDEAVGAHLDQLGPHDVVIVIRT